MWFGIWSVAFLAMLVFIVVLTLAIENWGRLRQPVGHVVSPVDGVAHQQHPVADDLSDGADATDNSREHQDLLVLQDALARRADPVVPTPVEEPDPPVPLEIRLEGRPAADELVAVLFASYAAQRLSEANRVAAWVTARERPRSDDGWICEPGTSLRGRPAAVRRLLDRDEEGRTWVTLNEHVDIGLGVARRPPTCDLLRPLVELWRDTRGDHNELSGTTAAELAETIEALRATWSATTAANVIEPISAVLAGVTACDPPRPVLLTVAAPPESDPVDPEAPADVAAADAEGQGARSTTTEAVTTFA